MDLCCYFRGQEESQRDEERGQNCPWAPLWEQGDACRAQGRVEGEAYRMGLGREPACLAFTVTLDVATTLITTPTLTLTRYLTLTLTLTQP
jgi:hypothetical protein